jgi:hypothetical protein
MDARPPMLLMVAGLAFVVLLGAALVPLMVKIVVDAQLRLGNGEVPIVRWFDTHRWHVTYAFWALFAAGLAVALPAMIRDGFFAPAGPAAAPAGALPPLEYQIALTPRIVLADTRIEGDVVSYDVREVWRQVTYRAPEEQSRPITPDIRIWKLLGYVPRAGQQVVLFLAPRDDGAEHAREVLPVTEGRVTYAPTDTSVTRALTLAELKSIVTANPLGK